MSAPVGVPYPAIPTFTDGLLVRQGDLNGLAAHTSELYTQNVGGFFTSPPLCTLRKTTSQTIPYNTDTQITWDVADLNATGMWTSSAPGIMTIGVTGTYFVTAVLIIGGPSTQLGVRLVVNGLNPQLNSITTFSSQALSGSASGIATLAAGSVVSTYCYQSNGNPSTTTLTSVGSCRMAAVLISN